jgi:hypothetical protein
MTNKEIRKLIVSREKILKKIRTEVSKFVLIRSQRILLLPVEFSNYTLIEAITNEIKR